MAEGKKTIFWVLGGCGCITLLVIVAAVALLAGGVIAADSALEEAGFEDFSDVTKTVEDFEKLSKGKQGQGEGGKANAKAREITQKLDESALTSEKIAASIAEPLTRAEVVAYVETVEEVRDSDAFKRIEKEMGSLKELDKEKGEKGLLDQMRAAKGAVSVYSSAGDVLEELDRQIKERGGYQAYYGRTARVSGVLVAARLYAVDGDPLSQATAKRLLTLKPEKEKVFAELYAELDKAAASGKEPDQAATQKFAQSWSVLQQPADVALARMPAASFQAWADLSPKLRERAMKVHKPEGGWAQIVSSVGLAGGEVFVVMAEADRLKKYQGLFNKDAKQ